MEWLTPSQLDPFDPADLVCTLCKVNLAHEEWPRHVLAEDHQNRAYAKCVFWDNLKRSCSFVIYCNIAVDPILFMEYIRETCQIELKDFILVRGKPTVAILQFHSSKEYMTVLYHSKQTKIRCGDLIVTHLKPAAEISGSWWMSLVTLDESKQTINHQNNCHAALSPIYPTPRSPSEGNSPLPGPSSSWSCQRLSGCPQGPESVRRLHQLAINSGWPPPKFERHVNDRLAGKYTAKVTLNGRTFCSNILAGDYTTACNIVADNCLKAMEKAKEINGHTGITPPSHSPRTPAEIHSPIPGPSSSGSCQRLPGGVQGLVSVKRLHHVMVEFGWPPPVFERHTINERDRLAGKYTAKVTLDGKTYFGNEAAEDYATACELLADICVKAFEKVTERVMKEKEEPLLKFVYDADARGDLCKLVRNRNWSIRDIKQYKKEQKSGQGPIYFYYSCYINDEQFFSPTGGKTRKKGITQLSAYCLKKVFNITRHAQIYQPFKIAALQKPADSRHCSSVLSSSLTSSICPPLTLHLKSQTNPPPPNNAALQISANSRPCSSIPSLSSSSSLTRPVTTPNSNTSYISRTKHHSNPTPTSKQNLKNYNSQRHSQCVLPFSSPTIAARIPQPVKRHTIEDPVPSTSQHHAKRKMSLNNNNKISTAEELMWQQLARSIPLPSPSNFFAPINAAAPTSQNIETTKKQNPEIEVIYDETKNEEDATAQSQEVKICDDMGEILITKEVWKKPEEELQNSTVKVKSEKYASPWPQLYLDADFITHLKDPVNTLEKICLVCNWKKPSYALVVSQSSTEKNSERFSYKMTLNEINYKTERVETTKKMAQEKVARICLTALAHNGEIPHPSVFMNVNLNPVERLENLIISRRLPKRNHNEPKYTLIEDLEDETYYCEVTLNGESYIPSTSEKTEKEAKEKAAEFCLQKLSSSILLYADGSLSEKAKTVLTTMSMEIPKITTTGKEIQAKMKNFKNQCKNIFTMMEIPEAKWKGAKAIVKKLKNLVPELQAIMYRNWFMRLQSYTDYDQLFIFVFETDNDKTKVIAADPKEIEKHILQSSEKFPGLAVTTLANTNSARHFKQNEQNCESQPSFVLETDLNTLDEVHLCRLIHYISEFDSRFLPVLSLLRYWAKVNRIRFQSSDNSKKRNWADPFFLDLLLVSFLGGAGVVPTARELIERTRKGRFSFQVEKICLLPNVTYVNEWKLNAHPYRRNSAEFWLSVLVLTKNFFLYYADRFKEGSWVLNICDSEMIFCRDLFYGSFHTKLSPEHLETLVVESANRNRLKIQSNTNDSQMYMTIPMNKKLIETRNEYKSTNLNWGKMINEMLECGSSTIFDFMRIAGTRLNKFLDEFSQNDVDLESTLNCSL